MQTASRYTGKERDTESGNDYFEARYYASSMGRFMSPDPSQLYYADPSNPQSFNLYAYGRNNPLINIDPNGLDARVYENDDTSGNPTSYTITNDANGGAVTCPGNGFYVTTTQQVTGVGFNQNGDLAVAGTADGSLINPDGSAYDVAQSVTVNASGAPGLYTTPTIVSGTIQYVATLPSGFNQPPLGQDVWGKLWHFGNWCGSGGQGPAKNATDANCIPHDACYFQNGFSAGSNFRGHNDTLQACNQALCDAEGTIINDPSVNATSDELKAASDIHAYFSLVPFGNNCRSHR